VDYDLCIVRSQLEDHPILADLKSIEAQEFILQRADVFMSERILERR